jgi:serine/threonine-protein kinase RsbW
MLTMFTTPPPQVLEPVTLRNANPLPSSEDALWLTIRSTALGFEQLGMFADFMKRSWNMDDLQFINIHLALSEAVTNAIQHGNKNDEEKSVHISAKRDAVFYTFTVKDEGDGFDYRNLQNPTAGERRKVVGGRGVFIMNYLSDSLHFSDHGKSVNMIFARK